MVEGGGNPVPGTGVEVVDKPKWSVFTRRGATDGANAYYRLHVPAVGLNDDGRFRAIVEDCSNGSTMAETMEWFSVAARSDFVLEFGAPQEESFSRALALLRLEPAKGGVYNRMMYPPSLIWSLDDNFHAVSPTNAAFLENGIMLPDGQMLKPGDDVQIEGPDGKPQMLWKHGQMYKRTIFDVGRNIQRLETMDDMLSKVAGMTVPTERLAEWYRGKGYPNVYTFPNSILFEDYYQFDSHKMVRKNPNEVRVMWQGGASHLADWTSIRGQLANVCTDTPQVKWMLWGTEHPWVWKNIPNDQFEFMSWVDYGCYKTVLSMLDFDFVVAPLVDNLFNQGKSAIKMYEAAALPDPKPCLAANVPPYSDSIIDGETGMLYNSPEEFREKFGQLAQNPELRQELGKNAQQWVRENRDARVTTKLLGDWLIKTREEYVGRDGNSELIEVLNQYLEN